MDHAKPNAPPDDSKGASKADPTQRVLGASQEGGFQAPNGRLEVEFVLNDGDAGDDDAPRATGKRKLSDAEDDDEGRMQQRQRRETEADEGAGLEIEMIDEENGEAIQLETERLRPQEVGPASPRLQDMTELSTSAVNQQQTSDAGIDIADVNDPSEPADCVVGRVDTTDEPAAPHPEDVGDQLCGPADEDSVGGKDGDASLYVTAEDQLLPANASSPIVIDGKLEEEFALVVLKHAPDFRRIRPSKLVWQAIVEEAPLRYADPRIVRVQTLRLCRIAANPKHLSYEALTPSLRVTLLEIFEHWKAARPGNYWRDDTQHETSDINGGVQQENRNEHGHRHWLRSKEPQRQLEKPPLEKPSLEKPRLEKQRFEKPRLEKPRVGKRPGKKPRSEEQRAGEIDCELEESMARILFKHSRDFQKGKMKMLVYQAIADDSQGRYKNGVAAMYYMQRLCKIAASPDHPKYHQISPTLRKMLLKFQSRANGMVVHRKNDERLMELVLELRPFAATKPEQPALWSEIIQRLGSPLVEDSIDGVRRIQFLTDVYAKSTHAQHDKLTRKLGAQLEQYVRYFPRPPKANPKP